MLYIDLFLISLISLIAIFTLISINPIYSVIGLIMVFILSGSYLLLISINFIGLSYFIIYVGAISILFLFAVMMLDTKYPEFSSLFSTSFTKHLPLAASSIILGVYIFYIILNQNNIDIIDINLFENINGIHNNFINKTSLYYKSWDNFIICTNQIKVIGYCLYTSYSIWLIYISYILLLAMIGPIILCFKSFTQS